MEESPPGALLQLRAEPVRRALLNLLENAAEAAPGGHVQLALRLRPQRVDFVVEDDGPGFSPQDLRRGTEQFYRGDAARPGGWAQRPGPLRLQAHGRGGGRQPDAGEQPGHRRRAGDADPAPGVKAQARRGLKRGQAVRAGGMDRQRGPERVTLPPAGPLRKALPCGLDR